MQHAVGAPDRRKLVDALGLLALTGAILAVSFGVIQMPFAVVGAVLGIAILLVALTAPLALVAFMLMAGPINLSFATGGFKSLMPGLGGLDMNGIRLVGATAGFVAYILFEPKSRAAAAGPLGRVWSVFLLFAAATLATSLNPIEGLRLFLKLAYPFLTFLVVVGVANNRERLGALMAYTLIAAAVMTILLNPLLVLNGGYRFDAGYKRLGGLGQGDNPFALYLTAMLIIAFTRFVLRAEVKSLLLCAVLVLWLSLTMTRIAALASVLGLLVIGVLGALTSGNRKILIASSVAALSVGALLVPYVLARSFGFIPSPGELFDIMRNPIVLYHSINWQGRELLWAILWGAFLASPVFGLGLGSSTQVIRETFPNQGVQVAHNEYMRLATDTGLVGCALFAIAVFGWLVASIRWSLRGDKAVREFAFPAVATIIAWGIVAATDNAFDYYTMFTQYVGFLVAGALVLDAEAKAA